MDFEITVETIDLTDHKKPPHVAAKAKIIKTLRTDARKLTAGKEVKCRMKYVDSAGRLDIAIYYGVERIAPISLDQFYTITCRRDQIVDAVEAFIEKELNNNKHDAAISSKHTLYKDRTGPGLEKARATRTQGL